MWPEETGSAFSHRVDPQPRGGLLDVKKKDHLLTSPLLEAPPGGVRRWGFYRKVGSFPPPVGSVHQPCQVGQAERDWPRSPLCPEERGSSVALWVDSGSLAATVLFPSVARRPINCSDYPVSPKRSNLRDQFN